MPLHKVCPQAEVPLGKVKAFKVEGENIAIYHLKKGFYATQNTCPHTFAPLSRGKILEDCKIQCPFHHACFDIRTGKVLDWANFPPGIQLLNVIRSKKNLKTYPITLKKKEVWVKL